MINMISRARDQVASLTMGAYDAAVAEGLLPAGVELQVAVRCV